VVDLCPSLEVIKRVSLLVRPRSEPGSSLASIPESLFEIAARSSHPEIRWASWA
jgi:hypothetical protein